MNQLVVPWREVRELVDLEYLPDIYEYLPNIKTSDLEKYHRFCLLKRQEEELYTVNKKRPRRREKDWSYILKLIVMELEYRTSQEY